MADAKGATSQGSEALRQQLLGSGEGKMNLRAVSTSANETTLWIAVCIPVHSSPEGPGRQHLLKALLMMCTGFGCD